ncbi:MAG: protein kinase [Planctomycetota bacterium]
MVEMPDFDDKFGRIAIKKNFITSEQLTEALSIQEKVRNERGISKALGEILVQRGLITSKQITEILEEQGKRLQNQIEGYEVVAKIGQGSMAAVFKAVQHSTNAIVALKVVLPSLVKSPQNAEKFIKEAEAAVKLEHPNIVRSIEAGQFSGFHFIAMEYIEGDTLAKILAREGAFDEINAFEITLYIIAALNYGLKSNIIHRNLKPENIIITFEGETKLTDLGIAKLLIDDPSYTWEMWPVSSANYISPEQAMGRKDSDLRTDIYSLGAILYHMLSGRPPFVGKNVVETAALHIKGKFRPLEELNPHLHKPLCDIVAKMMAHDREKRYQNYKELVAAIQAI